MPKPLDEIVEVMAEAIGDCSDGTGDLRAFARAALAALEKKGYVVVPRKPTEAMLKAGEVPTREIQLGNGQTVRGVGLGAAPWAIWPKMVDARPRHGISHLQEPYTPEPRKEES